MRRCVTSLLMIIAAWILGTLLLMIVYLIPQDNLYNGVEQSLGALKKYGYGDELLPGIDQTRLDYFTDTIKISTAFAAEGTLIEKVMLAQMCGEIGSLDAIRTYLYSENRSDVQLENYSRYWHGYQVLLRPFLTIFGISQIRMMGTMGFCALIIMIAAMLSYKRKVSLLAPFFAMVFLLVPFVFMINIQFYPTTFVTLTLMLIILWRPIPNKHIFYLFESAGIMTAYCDLLSVPAITLGIPLVLYCSLLPETGDSILNRVLHVCKIAFSWGLGYAGMWSGKWLLATWLTDENVILDALDTIKLRTGSSNGKRDIGYLETLKLNWSCYDNAVYKILFLVLIAVLVVFLIRGWKISLKPDMLAGIALTSLIPFLWYRATVNHSYVHYFYACKEFVILLYGVFTVMFSSLERPIDSKKS